MKKVVEKLKIFEKVNSLISKTVISKIDSKNYEPIVFMNTPINNYENDIIGINTAANSIKKAIDNDAKMIGIIADYGSGKSSLTETLANDKKTYGKVIHINMWDSINKGKKIDDISVDNLVKSFVFQLASGVSEQCAKYANRQLSKNYSNFSFSVSSWTFWIMAIISSFLYIVFSSLSLLSIHNIEVALNIIPLMSNSVNLSSIAVIIKAISPFFMGLAIFFAVIGFRKTTVAFSQWKNQGTREPEINEIFETYLFVYKKISKRYKHRLVIIDDLDRINDRDVVVSFLKEIYRISTIATNKKRKNPVFIVSIMNENNMPVVESENNEVNNDECFSKLFDYTITLKPIHYEDYGEIILSIIGDENSNNRKKLQKLLKDQEGIKDNSLPKSFDWIITGHNLTIRQLKDRLNSAVSLFVTLKNKGYKNQSFINFASCTAVTYLEYQYPKKFNILLRKEKELSNLINSCYFLKDQQNEPNEFISKKFDEIFTSVDFEPKLNFDDFKSDIIKMIQSGDISEDFRIYFYSFPKNSYIKNADERDITNLLLLPNDYKCDEQLDDKINRLIDLKKENIIEDTLKKISQTDEIAHYPKIIFENRVLFIKSYYIDPQKTKKALRHFANWSNQSFKQSVEVLTQLVGFFSDIPEDFWLDYIKYLSQRFFTLSDDERIKIRLEIIKIFDEHIVLFESLYNSSSKIKFDIEIDEQKSKYTLISIDELKKIRSFEIGIKFINTELINENNFKSITNYINKNLLSRTCQPLIQRKISEIYRYISDNVSVALCWEEIIEYLRINNFTDDHLFAFILPEISEDSAKEKVAEYLKSLSPENISEKYLELIDETIFDFDLSDDIINKLYNKKLFTALLLLLSKKNKLSLVNFTDKNNSKGLMEAFSKILKHRESAICDIRQELVAQFVKNNREEELINDYEDLFYNDYPIITVKELSLFSNIVDALKLFNRSNVTSDNYETLMVSINNKLYSEQSLLILRLLLSTEYGDAYKDNAIAVNVLLAIDYNKLRIASLTDEEKDEVLKLVKKYYDLSNAANAKKFMEISKCLFPELEKIVSSSKKDMYVELINSVDMLSDYTKSWLSKTQVTFPVSDSGLYYLLDKELYDKYLVAKVLREQIFCFEDIKVPVETLIDEFVPDSVIWRFLINDPSLIDFIIKNKLYEGFNKQNLSIRLRPLYKGKQTYDFFKFVLENSSNNEQKFYLENMGYIDELQTSIKMYKLLLQEPYIKLLDDLTFDVVNEHLWKNVDSSAKGYKSHFKRVRNKVYSKK